LEWLTTCSHVITAHVQVTAENLTLHCSHPVSDCITHVLILLSTLCALEVFFALKSSSFPGALSREMDMLSYLHVVVVGARLAEHLPVNCHSNTKVSTGG